MANPLPQTVVIVSDLATFQSSNVAAYTQGGAQIAYLQGTTTELDGGEAFYQRIDNDFSTPSNPPTILVDGAGNRWKKTTQAVVPIPVTVPNGGTGVASITSGSLMVGAGTSPITELALGTGVAAWLATPSSANLRTAVTDETGTGSLVFATSPTLTTPVINGEVTGTGISTSSSANTLVKRDANQNVFFNNYFANATSTVSAAGTTILTVASSRYQALTGSSSQTYQLPDATTMQIGPAFTFNNNSSGSLIITNAGGSTLYTVPAGGIVQCGPTNVGTTNGSWDFHPYPPSTVTWGSGTTGLVFNTALSTTAAISAGAASATSPVFVPQRGTATTGYSGDATHLYGVIGGATSFTATATQFSAPSFAPSTTSGIIGTTTNDNAAAGSVGETISNVVEFASPVSLTTGTPTNVTSISLTAGDWDVGGFVYINTNAATTLAGVSAWINNVSATFPTSFAYPAAVVTATLTTGSDPSLSLATVRISLASTTTIYLGTNVSFGVNTAGACGQITARRAR